MIISLLEQQARWIQSPSREKRQVIKTRVGQRRAFGQCVGFADGSLIPIEMKPARHNYYDYWSRKHGYSLNVLCVCDDENRITYMKLGWGGSTHDVSVFRDTTVSIYVTAPYGPRALLAESPGSCIIAVLNDCRTVNICSQTPNTYG
jgi:hypothetical protein